MSQIIIRVILNLFQDLCNDLTDPETLKSIQGRQVQQDINVEIRLPLIMILHKVTVALFVPGSTI